MILISDQIQNPSLEISLKTYAPYFTENIETILFFDIETTGFSPLSSFCYLIGCIYFRQGTLQYRQWFAQSSADELEIIRAFCEFTDSFTYLFHFNGDRFDLPFLKTRCQKLGLQDSFSTLTSIDWYKQTKGLQKLLKLDNFKQQTIQAFLRATRTDSYSGGELIDVYHQYISHKGSPLDATNQIRLDQLLLHNYDDLCGLVSLFPLLGYLSIKDGNFTLCDVNVDSTHNYEGELVEQIIFSVQLPYQLPIPVSYGQEPFYLSASGDRMKLRVALFQGELKYFYNNYKDYYYLPQEDRALHKSVAAYVDKNFRTQASASNCYTKVFGKFLTAFDKKSHACFQMDFQDKTYFIQLDQKFLSDRNAQLSYMKEILASLL